MEGNRQMSRTQRGFTLVELLTVVTIVAILSAIAVPSYRDYVRRGDRAAARTALLENAQFLERNRTVSNRYDVNNAGNSLDAEMLPILQAPQEGEARYTVSVTDLTETTFTLTATPVPGGPMDGDVCGTLTLDERGKKDMIGATASKASCWNR